MFRLKLAIVGVIAASAILTNVTSAMAASFFPTTKAGALAAFEFKGTTTQVLTVNGQKIECAKSVFKGVTPPAAGSTELILVPTYNSCTFAGEAAKVTNEGCAYKYHGAAGTWPNFSLKMDITTDKAAECHIVIVATLFGFSCTVTLQSNAANINLAALVWAVANDDSFGVIGALLDGITYTASGSGCGLAGISSGKTAKLTGEARTEAVYIK